MSIKIMGAIFDHTDVKDRSELLVLLALADWADESGMCYPSVASLAERARVSESTLKTIIREMEDRRWLRREFRGGGRPAIGSKVRGNIYRINLAWAFANRPASAGADVIAGDTAADARREAEKGANHRPLSGNPVREEGRGADNGARGRETAPAKAGGEGSTWNKGANHRPLSPAEKGPEKGAKGANSATPYIEPSEGTNNGEAVYAPAGRHSFRSGGKAKLAEPDRVALVSLKDRLLATWKNGDCGRVVGEVVECEWAQFEPREISGFWCKRMAMLLREETPDALAAALQEWVDKTPQPERWRATLWGWLGLRLKNRIEALGKGRETGRSRGEARRGL